MEVERGRDEVEEEEVRERKRLCDQKPRLRAVAVHHEPWDSPRLDRAVYWHKFFWCSASHDSSAGGFSHGAKHFIHGFFFFFFCFVFYFIFYHKLQKKLVKIKTKERKRERTWIASQEALFFEVKSLTKLLCSVQLGDDMDIIFITNQKIELL